MIFLHESSFGLESVRELLAKDFPDICCPENRVCSVKEKSCQSYSGKESHVPGPILAISGLYMLALWIHRFFFHKSSGSFSGIGRIFNIPAILSIALSIPILKDGLDSLFRNRRLNMDLLIVSASYLSVVMGEPITAMVVVWLINFSTWIENRTQEKTRKAVRAMLKQENREVWILRDEVEVSIRVSELIKGDILSLRMGSSVPADGTVIRGDCLMNEATLTGESLPAFKTEGDKVFAGTTVEMGHIFVRADFVGEDTRLAAIIRLIESGDGTMSKVQLSAEKFSDAVVPISLCLSMAVFFLTRSISRALSMLIIACPCGVALSTPTAIMAAMGNEARQGILIKGGRYLGDTGADAAIEHADIVIRQGDLALVVRCADLGQRTLSGIWQNYAISIGLNLAGVVLAAFGWLSRMAGALFHNLITVGVVGNSAKLLFYQIDIE